MMSWMKVEIKKQELAIKDKLITFYTTSDSYFNDLKRLGKKWFSDYLYLIKQYIPKGSKILDLGCGSGQSSYMIKKLGYKVVGYDISEKFLSFSKDKTCTDLNYVVGDATNIKFKNEQFDAVVCKSVIEHLYDVNKALKEMDRVLKKGGLLMILSPHLLDPFIPLSSFVNFNFKEAKKGGKFIPLRGGKDKKECIKNIFIYGYLFLSKIFSHEVKFIYRKPLLSNNKNYCGGDWDAVYLPSKVDLIKFLKKRNYYFLATSNLRGKSFIRKVIIKIVPYLGSLEIVARKN